MKIDEKELKKPDSFVKAGDEAMHWAEKHIKTMVFSVIGLAVIGLLWVFVSWNNKKTELVAQESYFKIEKEYLAKKEAFSKAVEQEKAYKASLENKSKDKKAKDGRTDVQAEGKVEAPKQELLPSQDLEKDYGTIVAQLKSLIEKENGKKAAGMAALTLGQIYKDYEKYTEAVSTLEPVAAKMKKGSLIGSMVVQALGTAQANKGDCASAVKTWDSLVAQKDLSYLKPELQLKMALCYQNMGDSKKATELLSEVQLKETATGRNAKKYLRAIKMEAH